MAQSRDQNPLFLRLSSTNTQLFIFVEKVILDNNEPKSYDFYLEIKVSDQLTRFDYFTPVI